MKFPTHLKTVVFMFLTIPFLPISSASQDTEGLKTGVVKITAGTEEGAGKTGTGFIVKLEKDALYILTASHVVEGAKEIKVEFFTRKNREVHAKVKKMEGADPQGLAILLVEGLIPQGVSALKLVSGVSYRGGDAVTAIGFPRVSGVDWAVCPGNIIGPKGKTISFSGAVDDGNSGGPLIRERRVIGIVTGATEKFADAVSTDTALGLLKGWGIEIGEENVAGSTTLRPATVESLGITDASVKFFEGGKEMPSKEERKYADRFSTTTSRYIYWELALTHPKANDKVNFTIEAVWYKPDGTVFGRPSFDSFIEQGWSSSIRASGWGWETPGNWQPGTYRVELSVAGKKIASNGFIIYQPTFDSLGVTDAGVSVKFFEGGKEILNTNVRQYTDRFSITTTRYIGWALTITHPKAHDKVNFTIEAVWYKPDGTVLTRHSADSYVEKGWSSSIHAQAWGWETAGIWQPGTYRIEFSVAGKKIASNGFIMYQPTFESLGVTNATVKFFEDGKGATPKEQRQYADRFSSTTSRYINWELTLTYPKANDKVNHTIEAVWYKPDGTVFTRQSKDSFAEQGWTGSYVSFSWGWETPGNWQPGTYRVELSVAGKKIADGSFIVN